MEQDTFTKQMRKATREIHSISDALVNAKLAVSLSDKTVWAQGLLTFYEIFRYLEEAMDRLKHTHISKLDIEGMRRTSAFQEDLNFYLGRNWTENYTLKESVAKYLLHLRKCEMSNPDMLMAYIYHLYMGLLSGGQILAKKRALSNKFKLFSSSSQGGNAVTDFGGRTSEIKRNLVNAMNDIANELDESTKVKLIEESKQVFILNNQIIQTIGGSTQIFAIACAALIVVLILYLYFRGDLFKAYAIW